MTNIRPVHTSNNVEATLSNAARRTVTILSTKSKQIKHVQSVSTLSKGRNFVKTRSTLLPNSNNVETTVDFVERIVRLVAFNSAASTLLLVWTGP